MTSNNPSVPTSALEWSPNLELQRPVHCCGETIEFSCSFCGLISLTLAQWTKKSLCKNKNMLVPSVIVSYPVTGIFPCIALSQSVRTFLFLGFLLWRSYRAQRCSLYLPSCNIPSSIRIASFGIGDKLCEFKLRLIPIWSSKASVIESSADYWSLGCVLQQT